MKLSGIAIGHIDMSNNQNDSIFVKYDLIFLGWSGRSHKIHQRIQLENLAIHKVNICIIVYYYLSYYSETVGHAHF